MCSLFIIYPITLFSQEVKIGDVNDGSRSKAVHLIKLVDQDSSVVRLDDQPLMPFSTRQTCGDCHNYEIIMTGWHFSAGDSSVDPGRQGHPWIYVDQQTSTQIPLSLRKWPGTYTPQQIGLSAMGFLQRFGEHMPGGGIGENDETWSLDNLFRWMVSGNSEINCLCCHDAEFAFDPAEYAAQISRENFRWAATASSAFAWVRGAAKDMPDSYDIYAGTAPDIPDKIPPQVFYDKSRFNYKNEVFFNVIRDIPDKNCYFCHSTKILDSKRDDPWYFDGDVHLKSGLHCVDCHRNGLNHKIVRGYQEESSDSITNMVTTLSCRGCHMGNSENGIKPIIGRLGAPKPTHRGIPPIHFEKLTCTACHSGEWPSERVNTVKTSAGHALGMHGISKSETILPHIFSPVLKKMNDGRIAPHNLIWPAFWAQVKGDTLIPLDIKIIKPIIETFIINDDTLLTGNWLDMNSEKIVKIIDSLEISLSSNIPVAYVGGGYVYRKHENGQLIHELHPAAQPYAWPIAHDIRPAEQSLGIRGCGDCHDTDAPFYFANLEIDSPLNAQKEVYKNMIEFQDKNIISAWVFSFSFLFRPWLKFIIIVSWFVIAGVLLLYAFKGLSYLTHSASNKQ